MKRAITLILVTMMVVFCLTGCGNKLSGTYVSEGGYSLEFMNDGTCKYGLIDGSSYDGIYKKEQDGSYSMEIKSPFVNLNFTITFEEKDIVVNGKSMASPEKFIKQ